MFGSIGGFELLVLAIIGLLVFGPRRLPEVGRNLARTLGELRRAAGEMTSAIQREADLTEVRKAAGDLTTTLRSQAGRMFQELESEARSAAAADGTPEEPRGERGGPGGP